MSDKKNTTERTAILIHKMLSILRDKGGEARYADLKKEVETLGILDDYAKGLTPKGYVRWHGWASFMSIELSSVGYIISNKGVWVLTQEGEDALTDAPMVFFSKLHKLYNAKTKESETENSQEKDPKINNLPEKTNLQSLISDANKEIFDYIANKNPYEFQSLVAALFRAMGYYTPFIAPKGRDGGIDIVAYQDPLGASIPQLKVQVKHYPTSKITVDVVRNLVGILARDNEVGVIVTSGKFTTDAEIESRRSHKTIRLIDVDEFINLWIEYYPKMSEEDKKILPIRPIYFLDNEPQ